MRRILKHLLSIVLAIIIVMLIQMFILTGAVVEKNNMNPTLHKGDHILVNKLKATLNGLDEGDIILYREGNHQSCGRIVGTPGESIEFKKGKLYRNNRLSNESYSTINKINHLELRHLKHSEGDIVPPRTYVVLNDNRKDNSDSRQYGFIQQDHVIGSVSLRYYPLKLLTWQFK
ncbi:signal peptidase I [Staphylococcus sp. SQ8-PEA]|uniref:Signal peptidase I n=1 Tax=Staphylococcus marylandisciuri TaxID=2981529 RepID=A0ABT2QPT0_9STAP|nr:signal peptidase I [Staphylococcus marylandisciuri]MCU5745967.1 signal peptidase I [Staphylococcus marylandisciuri]